MPGTGNGAPSREAILEGLRTGIRTFYELEEDTPKSPAYRIPLSVPSFGWEETWAAVQVLLSGRVTMGEKVRDFERAFADYVGVRHGIMVNSGSSANLLTASVLTNPRSPHRLDPGDEVITPALTWSTTVYPLIQCGLMPVFVDVDPESFAMDPEQLAAAITPKTRAIMLVHLLGNPCDMDRIHAVAARHDLIVIEDSCEAHGAAFHGRMVGSLGHLSTFSFYFAHHITTIEGGIVLTDSDEYADLARSLRAFGWIRDLSNPKQIERRYPDIDGRFLFYNIGYNMRPTEIQGAFGVEQIKKLDGLVATRRETADYWTRSLARFADHLLLHEERDGTRHSWYGYPITVRPEARFQRDDLMKFLEAEGIETRPVMAGNLAEQPVMELFPHRIHGDLATARLVMRQSFFIGTHQGIGSSERQAVVDGIARFLARYG